MVLGCTTEDGRYHQGGETWSVPGCARAVCAKVLEGGWQIAIDRLVFHFNHSCFNQWNI